MGLSLERRLHLSHVTNFSGFFFMTPFLFVSDIDLIPV